MKKIALLLLSIIFLNCTNKNDKGPIELTPEETIETLITEIGIYKNDSIKSSDDSCLGDKYFLFRIDKNEVVFQRSGFTCSPDPEFTAVYDYTVEEDGSLTLRHETFRYLFGVITDITATSLKFTSEIDKLEYIFAREEDE